MYKLIVSNLKKAHAKLVVLDEVSFSVDAGNVIAILGRSGAGKSTLLRCINQLEVPDQGTIEVNDIKLQFPNKGTHREYHAKVRQIRTKVGMVFQQFNLWPHMTVLENVIEAPIQVLKCDREQVISQARELLKRIDMEDKVNQYPKYLSGGQQQRVAIARALMMKPEIMLFDEPTSALDPEMSREVLMIMRSLVDEGMTILMATHEINFAREVASHVMFLEHGKVVEFAESKKSFKQPKTKMLHNFIFAEDKVL